jgi:hypothetical protein
VVWTSPIPGFPCACPCPIPGCASERPERGAGRAVPNAKLSDREGSRAAVNGSNFRPPSSRPKSPDPLYAVWSGWAPLIYGTAVSGSVVKLVKFTAFRPYTRARVPARLRRRRDSRHCENQPSVHGQLAGRLGGAVAAGNRGEPGAVRPGDGAGVPGAAIPLFGGASRAGADVPPHRDRRLVDGGGGAGAVRHHPAMRRRQIEGQAVHGDD